MENHFWAGLITFIATIGFFLLTSPTVRREVKNYFNLYKDNKDLEG